MTATSLETDAFLTAVRDILIGGDIAELEAANVVEWHHGVTDPDEDIATAVGKCGGVAVLIYDLGGKESEADSDLIEADAALEIFVDTTKRNRRKTPALRLGGQIRDSVMRLLHRHADLRNTAAWADCRVTGYQVLDDPSFAAWRITLNRKIYLDLD
jgi:hypothetical protein